MNGPTPAASTASAVLQIDVNELTRRPVTPDPHVAYYDAVSHSPWDHDGNGHLPQRGDWSTYRYTVKDLILGIVTHRYNKNDRRLEVRAYFVGEHPIFKELEASKALFIVLCCQAYQAGGNMELLFENGVPFDIRELVERVTGVVVSGHTLMLDAETTRRAFAAVSSFSEADRREIERQDISVETVCYNTYRGIWSAGHIKSLISRRVPLRWVFRQRLSPVRRGVLYAYLMGHLRAALLEDYALRRLEDRPMGESLGHRIERSDYHDHTSYQSAVSISLSDDQETLSIPAGEPFHLLVTQPGPAVSLTRQLTEGINRARRALEIEHLIVVMPMDVAYLAGEEYRTVMEVIRRAGTQALIPGVTWTQLLAEAEYMLSVTAAEADDSEIEAVNVDRFPD